MAIRAIVFDIGGVLEWTPRLGVQTDWEQRLGLPPGAFAERLGDVWHAGSMGTISEAEVYRRIAEQMGMSDAQVNDYMADEWREYVGTLNVELAEFFGSLRPAYQTAILSNSFVGAREREQALYGFEQLCDTIIYSHEVGLAKPDPAIFALLCERLGTQPGQVIFLDDVPEIVDAARAFGIQAILFQSNAQAIADIQACIAAEKA